MDEEERSDDSATGKRRNKGHNKHSRSGRSDTRRHHYESSHGGLSTYSDSSPLREESPSCERDGRHDDSQSRLHVEVTTTHTIVHDDGETPPPNEISSAKAESPSPESLAVQQPSPSEECSTHQVLACATAPPIVVVVPPQPSTKSLPPSAAPPPIPVAATSSRTATPATVTSVARPQSLKAFTLTIPMSPISDQSSSTVSPERFSAFISGPLTDFVTRTKAFDKSNSATLNQEYSALEKQCSEMLKEFFQPELQVAHEQEQLVQRQNHRQAVVEELYTTEEDYSKSLHIMMELWQPEITKSGLLPPADIKTIFGNIVQLDLLASELLEDFRTAKNKPMSDQRIGESFKKRIPWIKLYIEYALNRDQANEILNSARKNHKFVALLERMRQHPQIGKHDLPDFLIKPTQRIVKYPLLLRDLIKDTDTDHQDYNDLLLAEAEMKKVLISINSSKRNQLTVSLLSQLQPNLTWSNLAYDLVASKAQLIFESKVKCYVSKNGEERKANTGYLFDFFILVCHHRSGKWQEVGLMLLADCVINTGVSCADSYRFAVLHKTKQEKLVFESQDQYLNQLWITNINDAIKVIPAEKVLVPKDQIKRDSMTPQLPSLPQLTPSPSPPLLQHQVESQMPSQEVQQGEQGQNSSSTSSKTSQSSSGSKDLRPSSDDSVKKKRSWGIFTFRGKKADEESERDCEPNSDEPSSQEKDIVGNQVESVPPSSPENDIPPPNEVQKGSTEGEKNSNSGTSENSVTGLPAYVDDIKPPPPEQQPSAGAEIPIPPPQASMSNPPTVSEDKSVEVKQKEISSANPEPIPPPEEKPTNYSKTGSTEVSITITPVSSPTTTKPAVRPRPVSQQFPPLAKYTTPSTAPFTVSASTDRKPSIVTKSPTHSLLDSLLFDEPTGPDIVCRNCGATSPFGTHFCRSCRKPCSFFATRQTTLTKS
ncbi:calmodulin-binding protein [Pelomyxa schiedti]|nr:calmodulin-binding protein [Pelomyxa schiedti]